MRLFVFSNGKLGIAKEFVDMVKLLFQDARCSSHVPNQKRGETRLPIGSYLFLIMDEVLNIMIKQGKTRGEIHGIKIPSGVKE